MKIVLDTDIFIDFLRNYEPSIEWFKKLNWQDILFSAITEAELISGEDCNDKESFKKTLDLLNFGTKILVTNEIARKAGDIRREYKISITDSIIASTALLNDAKIISRNIKDYQKIKSIKVEEPY